jgi:predicted secreted protein
MRTTLLLIPILVLTLALAGCTRAAMAPTEPGITMETEIGDEFSIVLDTDPAAGYQWRLKRGYNQAIVEHLGTYYRQAADSQAGGADVLDFRAAGAGRAELIFEYYLPNTGQPEEVRTFTILVDDD